MTLVALPTDRCPQCAGKLVLWAWWQPPLLRHGGYGATLRVRARRCPPCGWEHVYATDEVARNDGCQHETYLKNPGPHSYWSCRYCGERIDDGHV